MPTEKSFVKGSSYPSLEKGKLRLYSMRFCPYAQRTRLILAHKKIPYETINVHLKDKPEWFLDRNPLGMVPVLEQDDKIVYESIICNDYIDDVYPQNKLNSSDPYQSAQDRMLVERFSKVTSFHYKILLSGGEDEESKDNYLANLDIFEKELVKRGQYFGGKAVSSVDFLLWPFFERLVLLEEFGNFQPDRSRFPRLMAWVDRMYKEPAVQECWKGWFSYEHP